MPPFDEPKHRGENPNPDTVDIETPLLTVVSYSVRVRRRMVHEGVLRPTAGVCSRPTTIEDIKFSSVGYIVRRCTSIGSVFLVGGRENVWKYFRTARKRRLAMVYAS